MVPKNDGFCLNSKRWVFMMLLGTPNNCIARPHDVDCNRESCSYYEIRKLTYYAKRKYEVLLSLSNMLE